MLLQGNLSINSAIRFTCQCCMNKAHVKSGSDANNRAATRNILPTKRAIDFTVVPSIMWVKSTISQLHIIF